MTINIYFYAYVAWAYKYSSVLIHFLRLHSKYCAFAFSNNLFISRFLSCGVLPVCAGWNAPRIRWWSPSTETPSPSGSGRSPLMSLVKWLKSPPCWLAWVMTHRRIHQTTQRQRACCPCPTPYRWVRQSFRDFFYPTSCNTEPCISSEFETNRDPTSH